MKTRMTYVYTESILNDTLSTILIASVAVEVRTRVVPAESITVAVIWLLEPSVKRLSFLFADIDVGLSISI